MIQIIEAHQGQSIHAFAAALQKSLVKSPHHCHIRKENGGKTPRPDKLFHFFLTGKQILRIYSQMIRHFKTGIAVCILPSAGTQRHSPFILPVPARTMSRQPDRSRYVTASSDSFR